jgi:hypothetical protein
MSMPNPVQSNPKHAELQHAGAFPPHNAGAPIFEPIDIAVLIGMTVMTLGPLAAYAFGMSP